MGWEPRAPAAGPAIAGAQSAGRQDSPQPLPAPLPRLPQTGPSAPSPLAPYAALRADRTANDRAALKTPPDRDWGKSSLGMEASTAAALSYLGWWLTGLVVYFNERESRFVRFHALQSVVFTGALTILSVLAYVASSLLIDVYQAVHLPIWGTLAQGVALLAFVVVVFAWLTPVIAAFSGTLLRIPFVAPYAERFSQVDGGTQDAAGNPF